MKLLQPLSPYIGFWITVGILYQSGVPPWAYAGVTLVAMLISFLIATGVFFADDPYDQDTVTDLLADDPWASQKKLMEISNQEIAPEPMLTKTSIMYGALIMEETGETFLGLGKLIEFQSTGKNSDLHRIAAEFARYGEALRGRSVWLREQLARTNEIPSRRPIPVAMAIEVLDGATDIHVVTAGLTISMGLPGAAGYSQVVGSNLSKANPATGVIDKTPDGKWIKGELYIEPDLASVVLPQYKHAINSSYGGL